MRSNNQSIRFEQFNLNKKVRGYIDIESLLSKYESLKKKFIEKIAFGMVFSGVRTAHH